MTYIWDYDKEQLRKSKKGRIFLLQRRINYGPGKGKKIKLSEVKRYWNKLNLFTLQRRLFELLIWGKYKSLPKTKKSFWVK